MWKQKIDEGKKALGSSNLAVAEQCFQAALEESRDHFLHTDIRIPQTLALLGQALLLQKKVDEATPFLKQASRISASINQSCEDTATADYLWAFMDSSGKDVVERRQTAAINLEKYLSKRQIEQLLRIFRDFIGTEKATNYDKNDDDWLKPQGKTEPKSTQKHDHQSQPKIPSPELTEWAVKFQKAADDARSEFLPQVISGYVQLDEMLDETCRLHEPPNMAISDHLEAMADAAITLNLIARAEKLLHFALVNSEESAGPNNLRSAQIKLKLAKVFERTGNDDQALDYYEQSLPIIYGNEPNPTQDKESFENGYVSGILGRRATLPLAEGMIAHLVQCIHPPSTNEQKIANLEDIHQTVLYTLMIVKDKIKQDHPVFEKLYQIYAAALIENAPEESCVLHRCLQLYVQKTQAIKRENDSCATAIDSLLPPVPEL